MPERFHNPVSKAIPGAETEATAHEYRSFHDQTAGGAAALRKQRYMDMVNRYYDLVTDFYEFGWGQSFHFAPRVRGESFKESLIRHELFLSQSVGLRPGMRVLDVGCGVGGPMRVIAKASGAHVVGLNNNAYQLEKCEGYNRAAGLDQQTSVLLGDFMDIPAADESFDAVFQIEATAHAPDKAGAFAEIWRVLKPGGCFGGYEWCMTSAFDYSDPEHQRLKQGIEEGNSLPDVGSFDHVLNALQTVGFEVVESRDLAEEADPQTPWYRAFEGRDITLKSLPRTSIGRFITSRVIRALEPMGMVPKGTVEVTEVLNLAADSLTAAGRLGIFTPMFYFKARKS